MNVSRLMQASALKFFWPVLALGLTVPLLWLRTAPSRTAPAAALTVAAGASEAPAKAVVKANYGKLPLSFEVNRGQAKPEIKFMARGGDAALLLKHNEAVLILASPAKAANTAGQGTRRAISEATRTSATVSLKLLGAHPNPRLVGLHELAGKSSYFAGADPRQWTTDVPTYAQVKYESVYPGIDLLFYGNPQKLEYDFVVAPGADPKQIKLRLTGARRMKFEANGDLVLATPAGEVRQLKPVVYQEVDGRRVTIAGRYLRLGREEIGFEVGAYDTRRTLVLDPIISYATYLGSYPGLAIALDKDNNAYISTQLPATAGALQGGGAYSVVKLNASGSALLYSATFGGHQDDRIHDLAVDAAGNCYLTGRTKSSNFPTTPGAFQPTFGVNGHNYYNAYAAKLNPAGNGLVYSTFLRGTLFHSTESKQNHAEAIAVDAQGNAYVTGWTNNLDFPTTPGAFQPTVHDNGHSPPLDCFVTKLNPTGTALVYSTYLGSGSGDFPSDLAVDAGGNVYVTGLTDNGTYYYDKPPIGTFPRTPGTFNNPINGFGLVFVTKFNPAGTGLVYSTILGQGAASSETPHLAIDAAGHAYIFGDTRSASFPTTPGAYHETITPGDEAIGVTQDAFLTKLNPAGSALVFSTFFGGRRSDEAFAVAVDQAGNIYLAGETTSPDFPQIGLPPQTIGLGEDHCGFFTKFNPAGTAILQSIVLRQADFLALAIDAQGNAYLTGMGAIPTTPGAYRETSDVTTQSFAAKLSTPRSLLNVSAANYTATLAGEAITTAFGTGLATAAQVATTTPLPTNLGGAVVRVRDSAGLERSAPLFFVSPTQINYLLPAETATGLATITVISSDDSRSAAAALIARVAPGLFTANASGQGLAAAVALRIKSDGTQTFEPVARFDAAQNRFVGVPLDLGPETEQVFLILYGTGLRSHRGLSNVLARLGGANTQVTFAGAQGGLIGLDQVNVRIPRSLSGRGEVELALTVDDKTANPVRVNIK